MSKAWKITIVIVSSIMVLIIGFVSVYYLWPWNKQFFDTASKEFEIPGLDTAFVPQGMSEIDGSEKYIISGYMSDGSPSRFYIIDESGNIEKYFTLNSTDGDYCGHAGGVVSKGSSVWTVGDGFLYKFNLSDTNNVNSGEKISIVDSISVGNGADFVFAYDSYLWIGESYKKDKYETADSHRLETRSGETNTALVYAFKIDESRPIGLYNISPEKILSIRGECQGIAVTKDGKFVMSTSYGLKDSTLYYYQNVLNEPRHNTFVVGKKLVDLWYLDNNALINSINAPSMTEEIIVKNDRVYVLFESACKKYKLFNRKQLKNVYSLPLKALEK